MIRKQGYAKILFTILTFITLFVSFSTIEAQIKKSAVTQTISTDDLKDFDSYHPVVKEMVEASLKLANQQLTYIYGSANPEQGGMDCSGTMHYLLNHYLKNVPRQSDEFYDWVKKKGRLFSVDKNNDFSSLTYLQPGDLLFWSGTYFIHRKSPITHVMMYLGEDKNGCPLMVGSSSGRTYKHKRMYGVSVYDFKLPNNYSRGQFKGYGCIPGLTCSLPPKLPSP